MAQEAEHENRTNLQKGLPLVGLSFWQAWWMLLSTTNLMGGPIRHTPMGTISVILIATLLGYAALTVAAPRLAPYSRTATIAASGAGCFAGSLLLSVATHLVAPGGLGTALTVAAVVVISLFNALLLLMWGERWSTLAAGDVGRQLCVSFAFAFALYFAVWVLPTPVAIALTALLAPLSAAALAVSQPLPCRTEPVAPVSFKVRPAATVLAGVLVLSVSFGCMQRVVDVAAWPTAMQPPSMAIAGVLVALFALAMTLGHKAGDPFSFYRPIVPCIACGILVTAMLSSTMGFVGNGLIIAGVYCLDMFLMFAASDLAYRARLPVALVFGATIVTARTGTWVGTLLGNLVATGAAPFGDPTAASGAVLGLACAVVLAGSLGFTEANLRLIYQPEAKPRIPDLDERCAQIAQAGGLSARELDVMRLLARGRSVAVISETLGIAQGTVKHHASNTYRKLGVYDRQGLIDIVTGDIERPAGS